jgi:hypothetical protein
MTPEEEKACIKEIAALRKDLSALLARDSQNQRRLELIDALTEKSFHFGFNSGFGSGFEFARGLFK